ncbi:Uncharacterised protein [Acinetobacter baumannii]|nr:Uncharacterised protein [Acinetobacter baumannii]SVK02481.1 Uncharacterised protein [Acinetobacter baumannii]
MEIAPSPSPKYQPHQLAIPDNFGLAPQNDVQELRNQLNLLLMDAQAHDDLQSPSLAQFGHIDQKY